MEVTYGNFEELLPCIESAISSCQFIAIDGEFSGLTLTHPRREEVLDDAEQLYARVRTSAQHFLIMQFGLSAFHWNVEDSCYQAQTFNFYTFPRSNGGSDVRFTCQASSLDFLREHGFDFNKFIYSGIPYVTLEQLKLDKKSEARDSRDPIVLTKEEDRNFVEQQLETVRTWVERTVAREASSESSDSDPATLVLEPSNSYLRAALYQHLEQEFGKSDFFVELLRTPGARKSSLKLTRATSAVVAAQESEVAAKRQKQLERSKGFANVMQCLTTCNKPIVGHNMLLDLAYLYQQFIGTLPPTLDEFRAHVKLLFPGGVYDTKYLAEFFPVLLPATSLEELHTSLAPKHDDVKGDEDVKESNEELASIPDPANDVHDVNGEGSMEPSTVQNQEEAQSVHVITANLSSDSGQLTNVQLPRVDHADQFDRYKSTSDELGRYHEAGFDAYMTGTIFSWLCKLLEARGRICALGSSPVDILAVKEYGNRIAVRRCDLPFLPLEGPIPTPDRSSMFLVSSTNGLPLPSQDELLLRFSTLGCPVDRVLWLNQMTCYLTLKEKKGEFDVAQAIKAAEWPFTFGSFRSPSEL
ncbi:uncharacterized protein [Physcomitrium patens]|uniref:Uncharacterized protein n=1 Tax=Physcomitrium patens TaxID=3218 RepID=A0A2K1KWH0_PHYPA|nr:poly(A)-specific ribonuclease PARN-like isoform X2 [Physcomitrium patens]PNR58119.1 hypothetical protein PHYPA_005114 [Physcomitrium patens]|eukprot:XP_024372104.1 poly(A)-specific ribonuclease PARN-like isoform X2 [Physcomitrella patens]